VLRAAAAAAAARRRWLDGLLELIFDGIGP
jgi:hypothetical protein